MNNFIGVDVDCAALEVLYVLRFWCSVSSQDTRRRYHLIAAKGTLWRFRHMTLGNTLGKFFSEISMVLSLCFPIQDSCIANHRSSLTVTCYFAAFLLSPAYAKTKHKDLKERSGLPSTLGRYAVLPAISSKRSLEINSCAFGKKCTLGSLCKAQGLPPVGTYFKVPR